MVIKRTGISLPEEVLDQIDRLISKLNIPSRSRAISEAIMRYVTDWSWLLEEEEKNVMGALTILYDHTARDIMGRLTKIQHHYLDEIVTSVHVHVTHDTCLEVIIVKGAISRIRALVNEFEKISGIKCVRFALTGIQ